MSASHKRIYLTQLQLDRHLVKLSTSLESHSALLEIDSYRNRVTSMELETLNNIHSTTFGCEL